MNGLFKILNIMSELVGDMPSESQAEGVINSDEKGTASEIINSDREYSFGDVTNSSGNTSDIKVGQTRGSVGRLDTEDQSMTCDATSIQENWSELPSLSVEKIYSFLSRTDQCRMSQVCQRWSKDYSSPSLWKVMKFYLPEHHYFSHVLYPEVRFASKYGCMFRHVEIICKQVRPTLLCVIWSQLKFFLEALMYQSQLISLKFLDLSRYFQHVCTVVRWDIFIGILNLCLSQRNLRVIEFRDSHFTVEQGIRLLDVMTETCSHTLRTLTLRGFVDSTPQTGGNTDASFGTLSRIFDKLLNLRDLEMDYSHIFEGMMRLSQERLGSEIPAFLKNTKTPRCLSSLDLHCEGWGESDFRGILPSSWKALLKICPNLSLNVYLNLSADAENEIKSFIVRSMPIKTLFLAFDESEMNDDEDINVLFTHLLDCRCDDYLEDVTLVWLPIISELDSTITPFLQACSKLKIFHLHTSYATEDIEEVLKSLLENKPRCLEAITLWFDNVTEEEETDLATLLQDYYPRFLAVEIELFLVTELGVE